MRFDRTVREEFLALFVPGGTFHPLVTWRNGNPALRDLQIRRIGGRDTAAAYVGLTSVLLVSARTSGHVTFDAHATHRSNGAFADSWRTPLTMDEAASAVGPVLQYLDRVEPLIGSRHLIEGAVHASIFSGGHSAYYAFDRESAIAFDSGARRDAICAPIQARLQPVLDGNARPRGWPRVCRWGTGLDALCVDVDGRLLAIEAKPSSATEGIAAGPLQVAFYAELYAAWAEQPGAAEVIRSMVRQRVAAGLAPPHPPHVVEPLVVVPVLAVGHPGPSEGSRTLATQVAEEVRALQARGRVAPLELWVLDLKGERIARW
jgi:hypothetical protein